MNVSNLSTRIWLFAFNVNGLIHSLVFFVDKQVNASTYFNPIADVTIKACGLWGTWCTDALVDAEINLCTDLNFEDPYGDQACEREELYSFESSYMLPNRTWWHDLALHGTTFRMYVTLDDDLTCYGQFETHVYYDTGTWVTVAVGSMIVTAAIAYHYRKKMPKAVVDLCAAEQMVDDTDAYEIEISSGDDKAGKAAVPKRLQDLAEDSESVTSTSYLRMVDYPPEGLKHNDRMEQVRMAHLERIRLARQSQKTPARAVHETAFQ